MIKFINSKIKTQKLKYNIDKIEENIFQEGAVLGFGWPGEHSLVHQGEGIAGGCRWIFWEIKWVISPSPPKGLAVGYLPIRIHQIAIFSIWAVLSDIGPFFKWP